MESTGSYWKPVWNVLESEGIPLMLANAYHIKNVPGRKTDIKDPEWMSDLLQHGLIRPSFVPDQHLRDLRELTRMRSKVVQDQYAGGQSDYKPSWRMPTSSCRAW